MQPVKIRIGTKAIAPIIINMVEALIFYADQSNWYGTYVSSDKSAMYNDWSDPTSDFPDGKPGKTARDALRSACDIFGVKYD